MQSVAYFAGAAIANNFINGAGFSSDVLLSLGGPLGVTAGAFVGTYLAAQIVNPGPNVSGGNKQWLSLAVVGGSAIAVAMYGGASLQQAAVMALGGGAGVMVMSAGY